MVRSGSWCVFLLLLSIHRFSVVSSASWSPGAFTTSTTSLLFSTPTQQPHPAPPFENRKEQGVVVDPETSIGNLHHLIRDNQKTSAIASSSARKSHWNAVACVALANFVVYTFRPYDYISWQMRFPRACWELSILVVSKLAGDSPTLCLLLALMTGSTALTDIFIWSPLFASFATFQTCSGGWFSGRPYHCVSDYTMGFGRLLVSMQSLFGGLFYLLTAVVAWNEFGAMHQESKLKSQVAILEAWTKANKSIDSTVNVHHPQPGTL